MKLPRKQMLLFFILLFAFTLSACSSTGQIEKNNLTDSITSADKTEDSEGIILEAMVKGYAEYYSAELSEKVIRGWYPGDCSERII